MNPVGHTIDEQAARGSQQSTLSSAVLSHAVPLHSAVAATSSATVRSKQVMLSHGARSSQHSSLSGVCVGDCPPQTPPSHGVSHVILPDTTSRQWTSVAAVRHDDPPPDCAVAVSISSYCPLSQVASAQRLAAADGSRMVPGAHVIVEQAARGLQQRSLSGPELSQPSPAQSVAPAVGSATQPSAHSIVEQAARGLQHCSLSRPLASQAAPWQSDSGTPAERSATVPSAHAIVEHWARGLQHSSLSAPELSQSCKAHSTGGSPSTIGLAIVPSAQVMLGQAARSLQHSALSAPEFWHGLPAHSAERAVSSATVPSAHVMVAQATRSGPTRTVRSYVPTESLTGNTRT